MAEKPQVEPQLETTAAPRVTMMGPITEAYEGDPRALVVKLNRLRAGELVAELQYRHHAYMAVSLNMPGVKAEFEEHAAQEAKHADMLAKRIQQLGGDPVFNPTEIAKGGEQMRLKIGDPQTLTEMIKFNYQVERQQVVDYQRLIREVAFHDPTTRRMLEDILIDTEHHAAELNDLLQTHSH